ncbi:MAG: hypothetical protein QGI09_09800, partial [Dehalococcoidia bacterium]|nr:hypothetical protein [Dehalococcoidia bacterium]
TSASKLGLDLGFTNWEDVAHHDVRPFSQVRVRREKLFTGREFRTKRGCEDESYDAPNATGPSRG